MTPKQEAVTLEFSEDFVQKVGDPAFIKDWIDNVIVPALVKKYWDENSTRRRKRGILKELAKIRASLDSSPPEPILVAEEVAERLRLRPSSIYQLTRRRNRHPLPCFKVGKYSSGGPKSKPGWSNAECPANPYSESF
jgi:hypothetical protein